MRNRNTLLMLIVLFAIAMQTSGCAVSARIGQRTYGAGISTGAASSRGDCSPGVIASDLVSDMWADRAAPKLEYKESSKDGGGWITIYNDVVYLRGKGSQTFKVTPLDDYEDYGYRVDDVIAEYDGRNLGVSRSWTFHIPKHPGSGTHNLLVTVQLAGANREPRVKRKMYAIIM